MSAVHLADVTCRLDGRPALDAVNLEIASGEHCAVVGPNGAGKSTLLRLIAGLLRPSDGEITVGGHRPGSLEARRRVAFVPDNPVLYDDLSVGEHLEFVARLHGVAGWQSEARRAAEALAVDHRVDDLPRMLSRGLRQRVALALAFVRPFDVLLLDEPVVGLDQQSQQRLVGLLHDVRARGATVVIATHHASAVGAVSRVVTLAEGRVLADSAT